MLTKRDDHFRVQMFDWMTDWRKWVAVVVIGIIVLVAPLARGLFFNGSKDVVSAVVLVLAAAATVISVRRFHVSLNWLDIAVLIYVVAYVSGPLHAADPLLSAIGAWSTLTIGVVYVLARQLSGAKRYYRWALLHGLVLAAVWIVVVGIANAWNQLKFPAAYAPNNVAVRLSSVFQYHNTFASFEGAVASAAVVVVLTSRSRLLQALYSGAVALALIGILESRSRGEELVLVVLWLGILVMHRGIRQTILPFIARWVPANIPGIFLTAWAMEHGNAVAGWIGLLALVIVPGLVMHFVPLRGVEGASPDVAARNHHLAQRLTALVGSVVVLLIVVGAVMERHLIGRYVDAHVAAGDFVARIGYWKNSLTIFKMSPIWGFGAGAWQDMYQMVRSQNYYVTQVHSSFFQALIDGGIIGAIAWVGMGTGIIIGLIRLGGRVGQSHKTLSDGLPFAFGVLALGLYVHSLFDWDMSFLYIKMIWVMALGVTASALRWKQWTWKNTGLDRVVAGLIIVMCLSGSLASWSALRAQGISAEVGSVRYSRRLDLAREAYSMAPYSAQYLLQVGELESDQSHSLQADRDLMEAERRNKYDAGLQLSVALALVHRGKVREAYLAAHRAYLDSPMQGTLLSQYVNVAALYGLESFAADPSRARMIASQALAESHNWEEGIQASPLAPYSDTSLGALALIDHNSKLAIQWATPAVSSTDVSAAQMGQLVIDAAHVQERTANSVQTLDAFVTSHPSVQSSYRLLGKIL